MRHVTRKVEDGDTLTLKNNAEVDFSIHRSGRAWVAFVHAVATEDGRVGETEYRVRIDDIDDSGQTDTEYRPEDCEHSEIVPVDRTRFVYIGLEEVN